MKCKLQLTSRFCEIDLDLNYTSNSNTILGPKLSGLTFCTCVLGISYSFLLLQMLRFQWSVMVWENWLWRLQKMMAPSKLTFHQTKRIALQKSWVDRFSFMPQGRSRYPRLLRAKSITGTPSPPLWVSEHRAPKEQTARVGNRLVHPKLWIFLFLRSGVWHQVATMFLSSLSLEYLDHHVI